MRFSKTRWERALAFLAVEGVPEAIFVIIVALLAVVFVTLGSPPSVPW